MILRPTVAVGLGIFGITVIQDWLSFLHHRITEALAFVRAAGFRFAEAEELSSEVPVGRIEHGALTITLRPWVHPLESTAPGETDRASLAKWMAALVKGHVDELAVAEFPDGWAVQVSNLRHPD